MSFGRVFILKGLKGMTIFGYLAAPSAGAVQWPPTEATGQSPALRAGDYLLKIQVSIWCEGKFKTHDSQGLKWCKGFAVFGGIKSARSLSQELERFEKWCAVPHRISTSQNDRKHWQHLKPSTRPSRRASAGQQRVLRTERATKRHCSPRVARL